MNKFIYTNTGNNMEHHRQLCFGRGIGKHAVSLVIDPEKEFVKGYIDEGKMKKARVKDQDHSKSSIVDCSTILPQESGNKWNAKNSSMKLSQKFLVSDILVWIFMVEILCSYQPKG